MELALQILEELAGPGYRPPVLAADAGYREVSPFRTALTERGIPDVVVIKPTRSIHQEQDTPAVMSYSGRGPKCHQMRYQQAPSSVRDVMPAVREME